MFELSRGNENWFELAGVRVIEGKRKLVRVSGCSSYRGETKIGLS